MCVTVVSTDVRPLDNLSKYFYFSVVLGLSGPNEQSFQTIMCPLL